MEKVLSNPRLDWVLGWKRCSSLQTSHHWSSSSYTKKLCTKGGYRVNACNSIARKTSEINSSSSTNFLEPSSFTNGSNGTTSWGVLSSMGSFILDALDDEYGGVVVNSERLPSDKHVFLSMLQTSLSHWKLKGKKGVWLKLPLDFSELVPVAVKAGFKYHHAEQEYVMLTYWIPEGPSLLPDNASHQVGVGGFVINDNNEVLVVQEKYCQSGAGGSWKLPTGFIQESEEIFSGAVREVMEETGIETEFEEIIAFRHVHHLAFGKSDLFFICMLRPLSSEIKIDESEILAAKWMPLAEFLEQPFYQDDNMFKKIINICMARLGKRYCGLAAHQLISKFDGRSSSLYYNVQEPEDFNCLGAWTLETQQLLFTMNNKVQSEKPGFSGMTFSLINYLGGLLCMVQCTL